MTPKGMSAIEFQDCFRTEDDCLQDKNTAPALVLDDFPNDPGQGRYFFCEDCHTTSYVSEHCLKPA